MLHNAHWLPDAADSGPSRYVGYYDAASLYPSSSKCVCVCVCVCTVLCKKKGASALCLRGGHLTVGGRVRAPPPTRPAVAGRACP